MMWLWPWIRFDFIFSYHTQEEQQKQMQTSTIRKRKAFHSPSSLWNEVNTVVFVLETWNPREALDWFRYSRRLQNIFNSYCFLRHHFYFYVFKILNTVGAAGLHTNQKVIFSSASLTLKCIQLLQTSTKKIYIYAQYVFEMKNSCSVCAGMCTVLAG